MTGKTVFVALSGGVDSAVAAYLLKREGYRVVGVFMKNWSDPLADECPWQQEAQDARAVCRQLEIPFRIATFEDEYRERVVNYLVAGYRRGITPNPDMLCNREIKFKVFLDLALAEGADLIATGHYVIKKILRSRGGTRQALYQAADRNKDQSYFLALLNQRQLSHSLFPIGHYQKSAVRSIARRAGLSVSEKKDSQGICFIGKVKFKDFIREFIPPAPGPIVTTDGQRIGTHDGLAYYTIGQRHGIGIGGGAPYYVAGKNTRTHTLIVSTGQRQPELYCSSFTVRPTHWISGFVPAAHRVRFRIRYRQPLQSGTLPGHGSALQVRADTLQRAVTPGQFAVFYWRGEMLGGGPITRCVVSNRRSTKFTKHE